MREDWANVIFEEAVNKISTSKKKIMQKEYLLQGQYPIIDQGQALIGGYTNDTGNLIKCNYPVLIIGDHTKVVKLINFDFAPGADGTKVLETKRFVVPKFLYYFAQIMVFKIKDKGYARHYQHIEKEIVPIAPLPEQRSIVAKIELLLSELDNGIANLKAAKVKLEIYRQAVLKKAFEGELTKEWREKQTNLATAEELLVKIQKEREKLFESQPQKLEKQKRSNNDSNIDDLSGKVLKHPWIFITLEQAGELMCGQSPSTNEVNADGEGILYVTGPEQWSGTEIKQNKWTNHPKKIAPKGSIFITVKGSGVGKLFPGTQCAIGRDIYAYKPLDIINHSYVYYALKHNIDLLIIKAKGDIPGLSKSNILNHHIGLCSPTEQDQVVQEIETRLSVCDNIQANIEESLKKAEALRQSILKKAFAGKLLSEKELEACRREPDWEPADKLLECINKSKEEVSSI